MSAVEILESGKEYTREELRKLLSGHLCRCTGYEKHFECGTKRPCTNDWEKTEN